MATDEEAERKKKEKFEKKKQKLLQKNSRLQPKQPATAEISEQKANDAESDEGSKEWSEMIKLLSTRDIVLKPQELYEYLALLIQSFAGFNIVIALNRNVINDQTTHSLACPSSSTTTSTVSTIECVIPIIHDEIWLSHPLQTTSSKAVKKSDILEQNITGFGILSDRKTSNRKPVSWYRVSPYFLSHRYEWQNVADVYLATLCKDYRKVMESAVDNTYRHTRHVQDAVLVYNAQYGYIPLFCSQNDVYYTDPRITYRDIKQKWPDNVSPDDVITLSSDNLDSTSKRSKAKKRRQGLQSGQYLAAKAEAKARRLAASQKKQTAAEAAKADTHLDQKNDDNDNNDEDDEEAKMEDTADAVGAFNLSMSIIDESWRAYNRIIRLWVQRNGQIYVLRGDGVLYRIQWNAKQNEDEEEKKTKDDFAEFDGDVDKLIAKLDSLQPNYQISAKRAGYFSSDLVCKVLVKDPNVDNAGAEFEEKCNRQLSQCSLFRLVECDRFDMVPYNQRVHGLNRSHDTLHTSLIYGVYYDEGNALYIVQNTLNRINLEHSWELGWIVHDGMDDKQYRKRYAAFFEKQPHLKQQECYIMFVDERDVENKRIIIIAGKYLIELKTVHSFNEKQQAEIGCAYNLEEIIPDLASGLNLRGAKWYYSYSGKTLYVFERMSASSLYPYRLRRIALSSFLFSQQ